MLGRNSDRYPTYEYYGINHRLDRIYIKSNKWNEINPLKEFDKRLCVHEMIVGGEMIELMKTRNNYKQKDNVAISERKITNNMHERVWNVKNYLKKISDHMMIVAIISF